MQANRLKITYIKIKIAWEKMRPKIKLLQPCPPKAHWPLSLFFPLPTANKSKTVSCICASQAGLCFRVLLQRQLKYIYKNISFFQLRGKNDKMETLKTLYKKHRPKPAPRWENRILSLSLSHSQSQTLTETGRQWGFSAESPRRGKSPLSDRLPAT